MGTSEAARLCLLPPLVDTELGVLVDSEAVRARGRNGRSVKIVSSFCQRINNILSEDILVSRVIYSTFFEDV